MLLTYLYLLVQSSLYLNLHLEGFADVHRPNKICQNMLYLSRMQVESIRNEL